MKRIALLLALLVLFPSFAFGQRPPRPPHAPRAPRPPQPDAARMMEHFGNAAAMQKMAEEAKAMEACVKSIDQAKLDALREEAEAGSREIERLCEAGKKDEALDKGMKLAKRISEDPTLAKMRDCTAGLSEMVQDMALAQIPNFEENERPTREGICDR